MMHGGNLKLIGTEILTLEMSNPPSFRVKEVGPFKINQPVSDSVGCCSNFVAARRIDECR